jgi:hypothetical protein
MLAVSIDEHLHLALAHPLALLVRFARELAFRQEHHAEIVEELTIDLVARCQVP